MTNSANTHSTPAKTTAGANQTQAQPQTPPPQRRNGAGSRSPPPQDVSKFYKTPDPSTKSGAAPSFIPLIDPTGKGGLIQVPVGKTLDTKGRTEFLQGILKKEVSLCCLYQKGRCHAAEKCHQIHVDLAFMRAVRTQNAHVISCCREHQDTASLAGTAISFFALHLGEAETIDIVSSDRNGNEEVFNTVRASQIAITTALTQFVEEGGDMTRLPLRQICRLHLRGACKYGKDCKRIHLCSKLGENLIDVPAPKTSVKIAPAATTASDSRRATSPAPQSKQLYVDPTEVHHQRAKTTSPKPQSSDFFSRVEATPPPTRQHSVSADTVAAELDRSTSTLAGYFNSDRFVTPPPAETSPEERSPAEGSTAPPSGMKQPAECDDDDVVVFDPNTMSKIDLEGNISFMERTIGMQNLFFDPAMLAQCDPDLIGSSIPSGPKCADDLVFDCGVSSTTSHASTVHGWDLESKKHNRTSSWGERW